jgi:hypothetical protein
MHDEQARLSRFAPVSVLAAMKKSTFKAIGGMNKRIYVCCLSLLIALLTARTALAGDFVACEEGISVLDEKTYEVLADIDISDGDVLAYRQLLAGCVEMYPSYSAGKRDDFLRLLNILMERVDTVYTRVSSEGLYLPEGASRRAEMRATRILAIKRSMQQQYIAMLSQHSPLDKGWGDAFVSNLFIGYESVDVDGLTRYGAGRFGVNVYVQLGETLTDKAGWGVHVFGDAELTSSAENSEGVVNDTYEIDANLFMPYGMDGGRQGRWAAGPVAGMKMKKFSGVSVSRWEYMAGLRLARSADLFIDGRYGKSEGVAGKRIEVLVQLPVAEVLNGDVIVGGSLNLSTDDGASSGDVMQMYLLWQIDFIDVLNVY